MPMYLLCAGFDQMKKQKDPSLFLERGGFVVRVQCDFEDLSVRKAFKRIVTVVDGGVTVIKKGWKCKGRTRALSVSRSSHNAKGIKSRKEIEATMKRILGNSTAKEGCNLVACEGHIQDLPADALSIRKAVLRGIVWQSTPSFIM
jgi:hypothetical protein